MVQKVESSRISLKWSEEVVKKANGSLENDSFSFKDVLLEDRYQLLFRSYLFVHDMFSFFSQLQSFFKISLGLDDLIVGLTFFVDPLKE